MSRRQKKKRQSTHKSKQLSQKLSSINKQSWSRGDMIAAVGLLIAIMSALLSLAIPEVRIFIGLDHSKPVVSAKPLPSSIIYRLKQKYAGYLIHKIGDISSVLNTVSSSDSTISFDWESPGGDFAGSMMDGPQGICFFTGKVTHDMHISFQCSNSNQNFSGYIYQSDGHIKGTMQCNSYLTLLQFNEDSKVSVTTTAPLTQIPIPVNTPTSTPPTPAPTSTPPTPAPTSTPPTPAPTSTPPIPTVPSNGSNTTDTTPTPRVFP